MLLFIFLGPPGSGKGTQADMLAPYHWMKISTGDLLRDNVKNKTEIGKQVAEMMNKGKLVSDEIVFEIIKNKLVHGHNPKLLLDGFPRNANQAQLLEKLINNLGASYKVLLIELSDEEIIKRNTGRRICQKCNKIYNIHFSPPRVTNICDECGVDLTIRKDDTEEVIRERIDVYRKEVDDLLKFYGQKNEIAHVNGALSASEIHDTILKIIEETNR